MDLGLRGKVAVVTGGSKGIGEAVAQVLAAEGCHLHLVARSADQLDAVAGGLQKAHGVEVATHPLDLAGAGAAEALVAAVGDVDLLVNNAGAIPGGDLLSVDEARWRDAWNLKVFGYVNLCRAWYARMKARQSGVIVNVIGTAGERQDAGYIAGSTGNAGLMAFTRALGSRSLDDGVRVVGVNPGPVSTGRIETLYRTRAKADHGDESRWQEYFAKLPRGRAAEPREVAELVAFMGSARASYVSGTVVTIDGGLSARPAG